MKAAMMVQRMVEWKVAWKVAKTAETMEVLSADCLVV